MNRKQRIGNSVFRLIDERLITRQLRKVFEIVKGNQCLRHITENGFQNVRQYMQVTFVEGNQMMMRGRRRRCT